MPIIIAEKPKVAKKIAEFLSNRNYKALSYKKVYYYKFLNNSKIYYVIPALGHLYTLVSSSKFWIYPDFSYKWAPAYIQDKMHIKKYYIELFSKFKNEKEVIIATDFDLEGELIGYNILRFSLNKFNAKRMVFSAITKKDIISAFYNIKENIYSNFVEAAEARHIVDWLYGINISRALTLSVRKYIKGVILSIGRVQGPTLKIIFNKEKEIQNFIPKEYYTLEVNIKIGDSILKLNSIKKFESKSEAKAVLETLNNRINISNIIKEIYTEKPPIPYNLSDIQQDSYKIYKITPSETLKILQKLYEEGYISYPRTDSQIFPNTINFKEIIESFNTHYIYKKYAKYLLKLPNLIPTRGKKTDIHPPIHPTGNIPYDLDKKSYLIYDLIVRRFFSIFYPSAKIQKEKIIFEEGLFEYLQKKILKPGWIEVYYEFYKDNFTYIPINANQYIEIIKKSIKKKKTQPPPRYNPASLIKKMESLGIGTKTTRSEIVNILYKRNYIKDRTIKLTILGEKVVYILEKYIPEILSEELTYKLEKKLEDIKNKKYTKEEVIQETKELLNTILQEFKKNEKKIGEELAKVIKDFNKNKRK